MTASLGDVRLGINLGHRHLQLHQDDRLSSATFPIGSGRPLAIRASSLLIQAQASARSATVASVAFIDPSS